ncbi:MAG TPA: hypothetical protein VFS36_15250 [Chitinophagaceae bacterium]|jgi:hypothetical protein|nr:hypothetical protein [Chitinophagaceae bacterium]
MEQRRRVSRILGTLVVGANILFAAWITCNGIDEGFRGTVIQFLSNIGLLLLLALNTALLIIVSFRN